MNDITELAQKPTRYGTNSQGVFTNQTDGAYVSYLDFVALVEVLEKAHDINAAAEKLVLCKGRYHSEQNYRALAALFGATTPDLPPLDEESRTVTVKMPKPHAHLIWIQAGHAPDDYWDDVAVSHSEKDRCCDGSERYTVYARWEIEEMLTAAGIKVEAE